LRLFAFHKELMVDKKYKSGLEKILTLDIWKEYLG
jgi:hypothetical protein